MGRRQTSSHVPVRGALLKPSIRADRVSPLPSAAPIAKRQKSEDLPARCPSNHHGGRVQERIQSRVLKLGCSDERLCRSGFAGRGDIDRKYL